MTDRFIKLPIEALSDARLSHRDLRVLMALYSFGANPGDVVWPSREALSAMTNCAKNHVSVSITRLIEFGWIGRERHGQGGNQYTLLLPAKVTETDTLEKSNVTDLGLKGYRIGTPKVTDSGLHITDQEQTKNRPTTASSARASQTEDKQPGGASLGGHGGQKGEPAQPVERSKRKQAITDDWQPSKRCLELLEQAGIGADFALGLVGEFYLHWRDAGIERTSWDATFLNSAKRQWQWECQKKRQQGATNVTQLRPVPSGHRNGGGNSRTFEQMRAENSQRAIDEFLFGDNVGAVIDA